MTPAVGTWIECRACGVLTRAAHGSRCLCSGCGVVLQRSTGDMREIRRTMPLLRAREGEQNKD